MSRPRNPFAVPIVLAVVALGVAGLGVASYLLVGILPTALMTAIQVVSIVVPPTSLALAVAILLKTSRTDARGMLRWFVTLVTLGAVGAALFSLGFSAGMDDGDAGRPMGFLGRITFPAAGVAVLLLATAITIAAFLLLAKATWASGWVRALLVIVSSVLMALPTFAVMINPSNSALGSLALLIVLVVMASRGTGAAATTSDPQAGSPRRVRWLAVLSIVIIAVVWGMGALAGITQAGRPVATSAIGLSAAAAQLAAVPLLLALAMIGRTRWPHLAWLRFAPIAVAAVVAGSAIQFFGLRPDGSGLFLGATIAGVGLGIWLILVLLPVLAGGVILRIANGVAFTLGACVAWFASVSMTGAILLVIPAVFVVVAGNGWARGPRLAESPVIAA